MIYKLDIDHLRSAFVENAIILTEKVDFPNPDPGISHKGILIIYTQEDPKKNMTPARIIQALKNIQKQIEENKISLVKQVYLLNLFV